MPMQNLQRGGKKLEGGGAMDGAPLCLNMKNDWIIVMDNDMQMKAPLVSVTTTRAMVHAHLASLQHPRDVTTYMMTKLDGAMLRPYKDTAMFGSKVHDWASLAIPQTSLKRPKYAQMCPV